jgi:Tol biopolymer transport system component
MSRVKVLFALWAALGCVFFAQRPQFGPWSAPANLDAYNKSLDAQAPAINWPGKTDYTACLSRDGLSLYFSSGRSVASIDIYVSQRESVDAPWGPPVKLGANVNTESAVEMTPVLSPDGHRLYFASNRAGGFGNHDIYVSRRHDKRDDFGWEEAENLGPLVNTGMTDQPGSFFEDDMTGTTTCYLSRVSGGTSDIFSAALLPDGTLDAPVPVESLNTEFSDQFPAVSRDGLEVVFASNRPGSLGDLDLWVATRASVAEPWSEAIPLVGLNSPYIENHPRVSFDGTELYFTSTRPSDPPVAGAQQDIYVATRGHVKGRPQ